MTPGIFVTDFDGTLARRDFYDLVVTELLPADTPNHYAAYQAGQMTHAECLASYFAAIRADEATVLSLIGRMELEPRLAELVPALAAAGWEVVVASAGCEWYIHRLLNDAGVSLPVHANRGYWAGGDRGLVFEVPTDSPFFHPGPGIDKAAVIRDAQRRAERVAFAGDGFTDVPAAVLVPPHRRFARADCAARLDQMGEPYRHFTRWADVAEALLAEK